MSQGCFDFPTQRALVVFENPGISFAFKVGGYIYRTFVVWSLWMPSTIITNIAYVICRKPSYTIAITTADFTNGCQRFRSKINCSSGRNGWSNNRLVGLILVVFYLDNNSVVVSGSNRSIRSQKGWSFRCVWTWVQGSTRLCFECVGQLAVVWTVVAFVVGSIERSSVSAMEILPMKINYGYVQVKENNYILIYLILFNKNLAKILFFSSQ